MNKSAELPSRGKLAYAEQGKPSGVPVLLLHGVTDSWRSFVPMLAHLPRSMHAFALSQRGHGDSDRPTAGYAPHDFAADLAAFVPVYGRETPICAYAAMGIWPI